jgi:hypothetical protein
VNRTVVMPALVLGREWGRLEVRWVPPYAPRIGRLECECRAVEWVVDHTLHEMRYYLSNVDRALGDQ